MALTANISKIQKRRFFVVIGFMRPRLAEKLTRCLFLEVLLSKKKSYPFHSFLYLIPNAGLRRFAVYSPPRNILHGKPQNIKKLVNLRLFVTIIGLNISCQNNSKPDSWSTYQQKTWKRT